MSEQSNDIMTTFQNLKTVYQETANLLQDASSILEKSGYRCLHGNTIGTEQSKDINNPMWWITPYVSRYFATQENPEEMKAIGVFFVDRDYNPIEPAVLIGCFKMKMNENGEVLPYNYWYLREAWFTLAHERKHKVDLEFEGKWNFFSGKVRAVPLDEIKNQQMLKNIVIDSFLSLSCL